MPYGKVILPNFDEGVDRKQLKQIKERFQQVNHGRLQRAMGSLPLRHQDILQILPVLYHVNHPLLPGYVSRTTPSGVSAYEPDKTVLTLVRRFSQTFKYKADKRKQDGVQALFMMGSTGTIAHSESSDVDLWLCHRDDLGKEERQELAEKAMKIDCWAASEGLELHTFLMSAEKFRSGSYAGEVDSESSGSAQHYLLLDEFYRTGIHLTGACPLWWLVPAFEEKRYHEITHMLVSKRFIKASEFIDFGGVDHIPGEEFVGAGMWQLYKGVDAPYKSVLKILLTEVYAQELPESPCLSLEFKQLVYDGKLDLDMLDPYVCIYHRLEKYLQRRNELARLDLVRKSFYLKVAQKLSARASRSEPGWRRQAMELLVKDWQWDTGRLKHLDQRPQWKVDQVLRERKEVVSELTRSYRFLAQFARSRNLKLAIKTSDMNILGRKLYAAFQRKAGKVEKINPGIAPNLWEENLAFYHGSVQDFVSEKNAWLIYRDIATAADASFQPPLKKSTNLLELVAWSYFNGMLNRSTRLSLVSGETAVSLTELQQIIATLEQITPYPLSGPTQEDFRKPPFVRQLILFVNIGVDPMATYSERGIQKISDRTDALGYSSERTNLVVTIDQIALNNWNEVFVRRYEMGETLVQCLQFYLRICLEQGLNSLPRVTVNCFCPNRASAIARRVEQLITNLRYLLLERKQDQSWRYVIEIDSRYFVIHYAEGQTGFTALESTAALLEYLSRPQRQYSPIRLDDYALSEQPMLRYALSCSEPGAIQVFYYAKQKQAWLYVVDGWGSVFHYTCRFHDEDSLLVPLHRFLQSVLERMEFSQSIDSFGLDYPLRYFRLTPVAFESSWSREEIELNIEASVRYTEIQAIGVQDEEGLRFDLFCDHQEFSHLEYGDRLFEAVAHFILSKRIGKTRYPCYLTDIDLSDTVNSPDDGRRMQIIHYLQHKHKIETELDRSMLEINPGAD